MRYKDSVVVVTGGAHGIGRALCENFFAAGAHVVVVDIDLPAAEKVAAAVDGFAVQADVGVEADIQALIAKTEAVLGPIDVFVSNAGVALTDGPDWLAASAPDEHWMTSWQVNVMAHVYAARALVPQMIRRGGGYFVNVASGASLLCQVGDAAYSTTKSAALGFAESLAITHGDDGIQVSVVCPLYVATRMTEGGRGVSGSDRVMSADEAADAVLAGMEEGTFLILPHQEVATYAQRKGADYDRWLIGMRRMRQSMLKQNPQFAYEIIPNV
ncbi:MAG: SDR family NAD(P)-dependent oxidoreductase [Porticoccaceae bacterium]|nr:SDR family NAD(P)-dependent oxidoreductase [Porticoccaceae bacterium]